MGRVLIRRSKCLLPLGIIRIADTSPEHSGSRIAGLLSATQWVSFRLARHSSRTEQISGPDLIRHKFPLLCPPLPLGQSRLDA